ncbi:MAG: tRNA epoxyqueuosine(34) reductase QueG [Bacteroidales bacterium]|nr:tRNA epoxyqueuosine(34) reductase QueG [Bacteroidales bacterium]
MSSSEPHRTSLIRERAFELGFDLFGTAPARPMPERAEVLRLWCSAGMNAGMGYLARDIEKRSDPRMLMPGAKSVIVTGLSYNTSAKQKGEGVPILSRYVYGQNYHDAVKGRLTELLGFLRDLYPGAGGVAYADSGPLMEKAWAVEAGLGWQGRHSVVINRDIGSFFFLGLIITDAVLEYDRPFSEDLCGSCRICAESCPTGAINDDHTIDARRCISNLTIENRGPIPPEFLAATGRRVYGCDICQEVCPWNRMAPEHKHPEFGLPEEIENMSLNDWLNLDEANFMRLFGNSEVARKKYLPFVQNVTDVAKQ